MLHVGESGSGKTGALASLATAGYNLYILDFDNGLDLLANILRDDSAALDRVKYETLRDPMSFTNGVPKVKTAAAWKATGIAIQAWEPEKLGPTDVIIIDTLSTMSQVAFNHALQLNGRLNQRSHESDYGWMADSVLLLMDNLTAEGANFNLIVNTHVRYLRGEEETIQDDKGKEHAAGSIKGLPNAKGQMIARDIGKYFNTLVTSKAVGTGPATKRVISTVPSDGILAKTSSLKVQRTYPIETGLAALFQDILGHGPEKGK